MGFTMIDTCTTSDDLPRFLLEQNILFSARRSYGNRKEPNTAKPLLDLYSVEKKVLFMGFAMRMNKLS